jgi:hypothetical protein
MTGCVVGTAVGTAVGVGVGVGVAATVRSGPMGLADGDRPSAELEDALGTAVAPGVGGPAGVATASGADVDCESTARRIIAPAAMLRTNAAIRPAASAAQRPLVTCGWHQARPPSSSRLPRRIACLYGVDRKSSTGVLLGV